MLVPIGLPEIISFSLRKDSPSIGSKNALFLSLKIFSKALLNAISPSFITIPLFSLYHFLYGIGTLLGILKSFSYRKSYFIIK